MGPSIDLRHPDGSWKTMDEINAEVVDKVARHCHGNVSYVARILAVGRSTLYRWDKERALPVHIG